MLLSNILILLLNLQKVGIPFEIKDYAISGNVSAKQSLLNCDKEEFCEDQEMNRNDGLQNQIQQQVNSNIQKDTNKQTFLDSLQSNLNTIMSQKNVYQQHIKYQNKLNSDDESQFQQKTVETENSESKSEHFEKSFQQNIQKQLQQIQQMKAQGNNQNQKQALNSQVLSPQSQVQQNIQQNNIQITNPVVNGNPPSSKSSVLQYQQYLSTLKFQSPSPSQNLKNFENQDTIQNKQSTPQNYNIGNYQVNNYMAKPIDIQESFQSNQSIQQNIQGKNSINTTTPNSDSKKINQNYNSQQNIQQNQYIPLSQQIQNQINNNRISEDAKKQLEIKQQNDKIVQQQLIEQQKQKVLKNYQDTILKQQQKQIAQDQQLKNIQDIVSQNVMRQKQQSMIQQQDTVAQISPGRRKTTDETSSNMSPKHVFLKLESNQPENKLQNQGDTNQSIYSNHANNQIFLQNNQTIKRLDTAGSVNQNGGNQYQKQLSMGEQNSKQQNLPPKDNSHSKSGIIGIYQTLSNQQASNNVNQLQNKDNIYKQISLNKGSAYQSQGSLQIIKKMMEQKDFKDLEVPKDFDNQSKGYNNYNGINENQVEQQSPEVKKQKIFNNESGNSLKDPSKKEKSFAKDYSIENQRQSELISNIGNVSSFQEDKKTEMSIQSLSKSQINGMNLSGISNNGKMKNSQESLMKSLEERKKYTIATNNQKCIILAKDQSQQQNSSFTRSNSQNKNQSILGTSTYPVQEDLYYANGNNDFLQTKQNNLDLQSMSGQQLQNYFNQQIYEEQIRQSQMLQQEDEEALQHQQYLREQDMLLQQQISQNGGFHSPHVYECTSQGYIKSNTMQDSSAKQSMEPIIQNLEESEGGLIHNSDQNTIQSSQLQNSNHLTFGPNQKNNLKQQMLEGQQQQNNMIQQKNLNVVNVNQMLKQQQMQSNGQSNVDSYQMSYAQSPDNNRYQNQGISVYSSIDNVSSQQYLQPNSNQRGRIGSNMSNYMKLNTSTDTVNNISRISNKTGTNYQNYNGDQANGYHQVGVGHSGDVNLSTNINYQNQQNMSYVSSLSNNRSNNRSSKKSGKDEYSQPNVKQINKKELNWLDYSSFERNNIWMKLKQQNRQNLKQEQNEREQQECTFKPSLIASRKPSLMKSYIKTCASQSKLPTQYSSNKKSVIRDYSDISRTQGMSNSGYFMNGNPTTNTTMNNNNISQNNSTYQLATGIKTNAQSNNITMNSAMKQSNLYKNAQNIANYPYQFLSHAQSPTSLHQELKKAGSYSQINQLKKNISSTPNLLHNISQTAPNSTQNKGYSQVSQKKVIAYQNYKPNYYY